jgi:hypothetical protein
MNKFIISVLLLLTALPVHAYDQARARDILNTLTLDAYEGRRPGTDGGRKTEYFLAKKLSDYSVYPGAQAGYFQPVPMLVTEEQGSALTLMDSKLGKLSFALGLDYSVVTHSGSNSMIAPVALAGHGYVRPDKNRDDYGTLDVKGKIVVIVRGIPDSPFDFQNDYNRKNIVKWAKERGAAAILFYQEEEPINGAAIPEEVYDPDLPLLYIGDRVLTLLLDETGYSIATYKNAVKRNPLPLETGKQVYVSTRVKKIDDGQARNVIGIVYGTDPVLKNELVVIGAHMDHIGKNSDGLIYPGADDNASGSAMASELARTLAEKPMKRSALIIHCTGEEDGLLGSDFFVRNPSIPLANIVGMINLDMEGLGSGDVVMAGGETFGSVWNDYTATLDSTTKAHLIFRRDGGHAGSDHASFMHAGCPTMAFWSRGDHPSYHTYHDEARWISDSVMETIGNRAEDFIRFLGDHEGALAAHADTAQNLARMASIVDFTGFPVDGMGTMPAITCPTAAWISRDATALAEASRRMSDMHYFCSTRDIVSENLIAALKADRAQQKSIFFGLPEVDLNTRRPADVDALVREGLSIVKLAAGSSAVDRSAPTAGMLEAKKNKLYALVPFDFAAPKRVDEWKEHALVSTTFKSFTEAPQSVRDGLMNSDALLLLEITETPTKTQLDAVMPGKERHVHLNFGSIPRERREEHARIVVKAMLEYGISREDISLLTSGNFRRFFEL